MKYFLILSFIFSTAFAETTQQRVERIKRERAAKVQTAPVDALNLSSEAIAAALLSEVTQDVKKIPSLIIDQIYDYHQVLEAITVVMAVVLGLSYYGKQIGQNVGNAV